MAYLEIDGIVVDEETGEVVHGHPGEASLLTWAAHQLAGAAEQRKAWAQQEAALKALLMRHMPDRKLAAGDVVVSRVSGSERKAFNRAAWREFMEDEELTLAEWREIALDAASIDICPPTMTPAVFDRLCFTRKRSADYVTVAPVRRLATARVVERTEEMA